MDKNCKIATFVSLTNMTFSGVFQFPKFFFSFIRVECTEISKKYLGIKFESNRRPWISLTKSNLGRDLQKAFPVNLPVITQRVTMAKSVLPFRELNKYFSTDFRKFFEFQDFSDAREIRFFSTRDGCEFKYV